MSFHNRIRLPLYLKTPQFPAEANRFRLSNGVTKTLSVVIRKTEQLVTDYMGEKMHQRLVIALNHDVVSIEGSRYIGGVAVDGEYEIAWPDFLDYPLGAASVRLQATPFDVTNANCQTCEEASQLSLVDDEAGELAEGSVNPVNVYTNDTICCFPPEAEIVSFNAGYLDDATIVSATGVATLTVKNPVPSVGNIVLATYRVTCPDGSYDEADIYGSIAGSEPECEQPGGIEFVQGITPPFAIQAIWATPAVPPAGGYEWLLYEAADPSTAIDSGTTAINEANFTVGLPDTEYIFSVRSVCGEGIYSPYTNANFTTADTPTEDCGSFEVSADDGTVGNNVYSYSFMQCDGNLRTRYMTNLTTRTECMLTDAFNNPVYFNTATAYVTYNYTEPC